MSRLPALSRKSGRATRRRIGAKDGFGPFLRIPHLTHCPISPTGKHFAPESAKGWNGFRSVTKQNEITRVSGATTPTYDNNGNLTKDENNYRFVYDAWNRQVMIKNASDAVITTNSFNGINQNIKIVAGSSTIDRIFSDGWQLVEEKSGSNTVTRNVLSPVYVDAFVLRERDTDANGTLDERLFVTQDANYNVTAITNASGMVQERYTYTPFGLETYRDASGSAIGSSTKAWVFLHQGGQINVAGDYDFRNRVLSPTLGRWLTNDPLGFNAGDVNTYRYLGNSSLDELDPSGLESEFGHWHHKFNQAIFRPIVGDWIDNKEHGIILPPGVHVGRDGIHPAYNRVWQDWVDKQMENGLPINEETMNKQYEDIKDLELFKDKLLKGTPAPVPYPKWQAWKERQKREKNNYDVIDPFIDILPFPARQPGNDQVIFPGKPINSNDGVSPISVFPDIEPLKPGEFPGTRFPADPNPGNIPTIISNDPSPSSWWDWLPSWETTQTGAKYVAGGVALVGAGGLAYVTFPVWGPPVLIGGAAAGLILYLNPGDGGNGNGA